MTRQTLNRREWLGTTAGALSLAACGDARQASGPEAKRSRVAAVITEFTHRSHAHVILENFLEPYYFNGKLTESGVMSIGEHGSYPQTDRGAIMYPRKRFFDEIVAVFRQSNRVVRPWNCRNRPRTRESVRGVRGWVL